MLKFRVHNWHLHTSVGPNAAVVESARPQPLPPDTEARIADFADLVAAAITKAETRVELTASRSRIVAAGDDARRRFERDLHDGAQQRLVSLGLALRTAEASVPAELHTLKRQISDVVVGLAGSRRTCGRSHGGLIRRSCPRADSAPRSRRWAAAPPSPSNSTCVDRQLPESAEVAAYYVVAEAATNAAKHAHASQVSVRVEADDANLHLSIRDDGIGGADSAKGSGLTGLIGRVEALGGTMAISCHTGNGTSLLVTIPLETH